MARIEITKEYMEDALGLKPKVNVVASNGGMSLMGECIICPNPNKVVDIDSEGDVEVLKCTGPKDDCLGQPARR